MLLYKVKDASYTNITSAFFQQAIYIRPKVTFSLGKADS